MVEAFGFMTKLMPRDKLEEYLPRLLQGITNLYKRQTEHYMITQVRFYLVIFSFLSHKGLKIHLKTYYRQSAVAKATKNENTILKI